MINCKLPYGKEFLPLTLPEEQVKAVLTSELESYRPAYEAETLVRLALENPINSLPLHELSRGKAKVTIPAPCPVNC